MLKSENRLKKRADFAATLKQGRRFRGHYLSIAWLEAKGAELRVGVVVSKKVSNKAVVRNRVRRIISHLMEHVLREQGQGLGDLVVVANRLPESNVFSSLEKDIQKWRNDLPSS